MRLGVLFLLLGASMTALGVVAGGPAVLLLWPALSFMLVGAGYLGLGARVFGKRADGTFPLWSRVALAPYRGLAWLIWQGLRASRVRPYTLVAPGLYLARRLLARELPPDVELIVDLTAEFNAPLALREGRAYRSLPSLDAHVPNEAAFRDLLDEVAASPSVTLVHCAAGHGRSACFVAALLIKRGLARDVEDAERIIKETRPTIHLGRTQRALVARVTQARLLPRATASSEPPPG